MKSALFVLITLVACMPGFAGTDQTTDPVEQVTNPAVGSQQPEQQSEPSPPPLLTDQELAELSARAKQPGGDVAGGALSNEHLTYIVIALAAAVLVLVLK